MAQLGFDARTVAPQVANSALPRGWYSVIIKESEMKPTSSGTGAYLQLKYEVIEPAFAAGRVIFDRLNLRNENSVAVDIAFKQLSAIAHAVNVLDVDYSERLHNIPFKVRLKYVGPTPDYEEKNEVTGYNPMNADVTMATQEAKGAPLGVAGGFGAAAPAGIPPGFGAPAGVAPAGGVPPGFGAPAGAPVGAPPAYTPPAYTPPAAAAPVYTAPPGAAPAGAPAGFTPAAQPWEVNGPGANGPVGGPVEAPVNTVPPAVQFADPAALAAQQQAAQQAAWAAQQAAAAAAAAAAAPQAQPAWNGAPAAGAPASGEMPAWMQGQKV